MNIDAHLLPDMQNKISNEIRWSRNPPSLCLSMLNYPEGVAMSFPVTDFQQSSKDYRLVEQAIMYLENHAQDQPELSEIASAVGLSEYHFQRKFSRWVGLSPKRFLKFIMIFLVFIDDDTSKHIQDKERSGLSGLR